MDVPNWSVWEPNLRATLLFVRNGNEVLLIRKKRGLGAGKVNGPGGKIELGETAAECAARETEEEVGVLATGLSEMGHLHFQFTDGLAIHCTVFESWDYQGEAIETAEAVPFWCVIDEIPYDEMWADDEYWLPRVLNDGCRFKGYFLFEDDTMLSKDVRFEDER